MGRKLLLAGAAGLVVLTGLGAVAVHAAGSGPTYLHVRSWTAETQSAGLAKLSVTTDGDITRQPDPFIRSNPVAGLAWADLGTGKVFVTTIHPVLGRDSHQNPDAWHAHTATLGGGATAPNDFCVRSIDSTPTAGIAIQGNTMSVAVRSGELPVPADAFDLAVGFVILPDAACASGLAVRTVA